MFEMESVEQEECVLYYIFVWVGFLGLLGICRVCQFYFVIFFNLVCIFLKYKCVCVQFDSFWLGLVFFDLFLYLVDVNSCLQVGIEWSSWIEGDYFKINRIE